MLRRGLGLPFIKRLFLSLACAVPLLGFAVEGQPKAIVLYPEMRQPYSKLFEDIISGISESFTGELITVPVRESESRFDHSLSDDIRPDVVIALGNRGYEAAVDRFSDTTPVVLAGVSGMGPLLRPGISVLPDPVVVFSRLNMLAPSVRSMHVLLRKGGDEEYSHLISQAATDSQLQVTLYECVDFRDCAESVRHITENNLGRNDGVWLADSGAVDNAILGVILEAAWRNRFVVISNNPAHVRRGVLFALYPHNQKMGITLGKLASGLANNGGEQEGMQPLRDVSLAVNLRTGHHIGLVFNRSVRNQIDLVFPAN